MITPPDQLLIHLNSWIIQDENYGDFHQGQTCKFALEFWPSKGAKIQSWPHAHTKVLELESKKEGSYRAIGNIIYTTEEWAVLDFGILAYAPKRIFDGMSIKNAISSQIHFGVDPFFYVEEISNRSDAPAMIYGWRVDEIYLETAPFIEKGGLMTRDPKKLNWRKVERTNAWEDDHQQADYLFACSITEFEPKLSRK